jgi:hypothetical protein
MPKVKLHAHPLADAQLRGAHSEFFLAASTLHEDAEAALLVVFLLFGTCE